MKISILTPTYNRAHLLINLYESICQNVKHYKNAEWLIMDDGSTDNTKEIVSKWQKEKKVKISYYYQSNAGKMSAINALIKHVTGDIIIEIDSDDYFASNCFKDIVDDYKKIEKDDNVYGVLYLKQFKDSKIDNKFPVDHCVMTLFDLYYKHDYQVFDTALTFKADMRKKFKHKLEHNEKFITEARMYHEMDRAYKGLYLVNKDIIICQYNDDGYTKNILNLFKNNPYGYYQYFKELLAFNMKQVLFKKRLYMIKHYILFSTLTKINYIKAIHNVKGLLNKILIMVLYFPGKIMTNKKMK